jgi:hypothetical protein
MGTSDGSILGTTKIVDSGPNGSRFNVVLMGDGYQSSQMAKFAQDAQTFVNTLLATSPFNALRARINVHRVDVTSTDSGADEPALCGGSGATPRTYFDASFCNSGVQRLLMVNSGTAITVADAQVPEHHVVMVIVNSTLYGGSGGPVACFSLAANASEIGIHEMGHSAFGLADEYESYLGCGLDTDRNNHPAVEPAEPNVTVNSNRDTIKWRDLIGSATAMPTTHNANCSNCDPQPNPVAEATVGAFEGAHYYHCGAFRPQFNCRMRVLGNPFCAVCERRIRTILQPFSPTVAAPQLVLADFGYTAGGWRVDKHPRFLADLTGDGRADIVGFGDAGVSVALNNGNGTFGTPHATVADFGYGAGWRVDKHPRFVVDLTGDGRADIVGFGDAGVSVALNNGNGTFGAPQLVVTGFGYSAGGWRLEKHPRFLADLTGDGRADIIGFADDGVWVALNNGNGTFTAPRKVLADFGYNAGGWRVEKHPRFLADLTGDGRADIIGFGESGVSVALNNGDGTFGAPQMVIADFGYSAGWRIEQHPRILVDVTGDGHADIVGFGDAGVWISVAS